MDSLFGSDRSLNADFSYDLRDKPSWKLSTIRIAEYLEDLSAFAIEPTNGFLAVGSKQGQILLFGAPSVGSVIHVPRAAGVKFLQFAVLVFKLLCVDDRGNLHVWDLSQLGQPKLVTSEAYREPICCFAVSPCHSHAFIGLKRGAIVTYDILCLCRSPYVIPDLWTTHELDIMRSGMPSSPVQNSSDLMDLVIHPRDLNLLFVAYAGGIVLYDLTERRAIRHYGLLIPPGAPGALGYHDPNILQARRPVVTAITVHASGQIFATGHLDGSIAFWAVDDEDRPLTVRTIDSIDINFPDAEKLDMVLSGDQRPPQEVLEKLRPEPVFKLSWSTFGNQVITDPYSADTVLVILGGSVPGTEVGATALHIPRLSLPAPSTTQARQPIHPEIRSVLVKAFSVTIRRTYTTSGPVADCFFVPEDSPHFGNGLNPMAIVMMTENPADIEAKEFPPPAFGISQALTPASSAAANEPSDPLDKDLSSTLRELNLSSDPADFTHLLPSALWTGAQAISDGDILRIEKEQYDLLVHGLPDKQEEIGKLGRGGIAWVDYADEDQAGDLLFTKRQPHRLLITHHQNLTVRFQDISPQLLIGSVSSPLTTPFPSPLPRLTISLTQLLMDPSLADAGNAPLPEQAEIKSVQLTSESSECVVILRSGHVFVFGFDVRERNASRAVEDQGEIVQLMHIPTEAGTFQPTLMVDNTWGAVTACEMSNIGFLAIAYSGGALVVIDMRHPAVIFRDGTDSGSQKRKSFLLHGHGSQEDKKIVSLKWYICGFDGDETPRVRLLASLRSGSTRLFTLAQASPRTWTVEETVKKLEGSEHPLPRGAFVLSATDGASRASSRATFAEALQRRAVAGGSPRAGDAKDGTPHCFWVSAGEKGVRCTANFTGGRVGKADWGKGRKVECVEVVYRSGMQALVAVMDTREVCVYALPSLDPLHTFQLIKQPNSAISLDDTGDFVDWTFTEQTPTVCRATLGTFFASRRVYDEPLVDYTAGRRAAPAMPQPLPLAPVSYLGSWFNFKRGITGDAIDALLAGPNRPVPDELSTSAVVNGQWQKQVQSRAQALANQASRTGSDLYKNLANAMNDRGDLLSGMDERMSALGDGGRKMMLEAKRIAAEQSAKRWFGF